MPAKHPESIPHPMVDHPGPGALASQQNKTKQNAAVSVMRPLFVKNLRVAAFCFVLFCFVGSRGALQLQRLIRTIIRRLIRAAYPDKPKFTNPKLLQIGAWIARCIECFALSGLSGSSMVWESAYPELIRNFVG